MQPASPNGLRLTFAGSAALVTGASSGIGRACALMLASAGLEVLALDRDDRVEQTAAEIAEAGGRAVAIVADVTDEPAVSAALALVDAQGLAHVVNCAGVHGQHSFDDITHDEWQRVLEVNLMGVFGVTRAAAPWLRAHGSGSVVNITSVEAHRVVALVNPDAVPHYAASKAAVEMLTRTTAHTLASDNIRVNAVAPGFIATPMALGNHGGDGAEFPAPAASHALIKRYADPAEVASAIAFLLSDAASYITGTTLAVDGGYLSL